MLSKKSKVPEFVEHFFTEVSDGSSVGVYSCKLCPDVTRKKNGPGFGNLKKHLITTHPDFEENLTRIKNGGTLDSFIDTKLVSRYKWLHWIVNKSLPFNIVEDRETRSLINLPTMGVKLLMKCLEAVTIMVEKKIEKLLPDKFAIIMDGWSSGNTHFVGSIST